MILEEVELRNFRSHERTRITLDQGITVIVGGNGSGKTSLLEAVNFALFKQRPANVNIDDLVRRGTRTGRVAVKFHSMGRVFKVVRERRLGKSTASALYLIQNGREGIKARGEREVNRGVEEAVGMKGDLFTSAVYIRQGEIDALISAEPAKRKALVGRLIGAEDLEKAYQRMLSLVHHYDSRAREYTSIPAEIEKLAARVREEGKRTRLLQGKHMEVGERLEKKKSSLKIKEEQLEGIERYCSLEKEMRSREAELRSLGEKIAQIEEYERVIKSVTGKAERYNELREELKALEGKLRGIREQRGKEKALEREMENHRAQIRRLDSELARHLSGYSRLLGCGAASVSAIEEALALAREELERKKSEAADRVNEVSEGISKMEGGTLELEKAVAELTRAVGKCPVCSRPLTEEHKEELLKEYRATLERNRRDMEASRGVLEGLIKSREELDSRIRELQEINIEVLKAKQRQRTELEERVRSLIGFLEDVQKATAGMVRVEEEIASREEAKAGLQEDYNRYIEAVGYLRRNAPEKGSLRESSKVLEREALRLGGELRSIAGGLEYTPDTGRLKDAKKEVHDMRREVTQLEKEKSGIERETRIRRENIALAEGELRELRRRKLEGEKIARFVVFLEKVRSLFHKDSIQRELRVRAKPLIEKYTREIFDEFGLPYSDIALNEDFDLTLYGIGGEESADMLSGGERIASALALRLGISKALAGTATELIMLDEPTIHLDATRRRELVEIIRKLATIPQTIVVTHDKEFEGAADKLLLVEKTRGISRVAES